MLMHNNLRLLSGGAETIADEIDLGLDHGEVILRSTLQDEARAQGREIRDAGDVQENILRQHRCEPGENLLGPPALPLEVHNVRLHEHRAAIAENRHGLRRERQISVLSYVQPESLRGGLQKISIAGGALCV